MGSIEVSVLCATYNQVRYIKEALDSFLMQETNFAFEVLVHDDASTDGTLEIVRQYASRYSNVELLDERENQYSRGKGFRDFFMGHIKGRYVALCEGDDWWISPNKLQNQFDYMESHPKCAACAHGALIFDASGNRCVGKILPSGTAKDYSTDEIIVNNAPFSTNSLFYRVEFFQQPSVYMGWGIGDYPTCIWLSTQGSFHFNPEIMSAYRSNAQGSWSRKMRESKEFALKNDELYRTSLQRFDQYSDYSYHKSVTYMLRESIINSCVRCGDFSSIVSGDCAAVFNGYPLKRRVKIALECKAPRISLAMERAFKKIKALLYFRNK